MNPLSAAEIRLLYGLLPTVWQILPTRPCIWITRNDFEQPAIKKEFSKVSFQMNTGTDTGNAKATKITSGT